MLGHPHGKNDCDDGAMPDGPKKWAMNKHLAMVNAAMAKDGVRGCNLTMIKMMKGKKMSMMKAGM